MSKYWISKYVLSKGIYQIDAEPHSTNENCIVFSHAGRFPAYFYRPDWHDTELEARQQARHIIQNKISKTEKLKEKYQRLLETY